MRSDDSQPWGSGPSAHAFHLIEACWYGVVCSDQQRMTALCQVPLERLRTSGAEHNEYLYHRVGALQAY
ncbi:Imm49 family immunity protein [Streptomyces sp. NPDC015131]|uniref:Imm49 family immunity protein n=1 Tax=Streptomyces sp. NPDC015131 TaxID=3364941 RepID=UPI0036F92233